MDAGWGVADSGTSQVRDGGGCCCQRGHAPGSQAEEMVGAYSRDLGVPSPVTRQAGSTAANLTFYALALHPNGTQARWSSWGTAKPSAAVGSDVCDRPLILRHALWRSMQVPVMHSDVGFNLLYQSNVPEEIIRSVRTLLSEFPGGLLTPAGRGAVQTAEHAAHGRLPAFPCLPCLPSQQAACSAG